MDQPPDLAKDLIAKAEESTGTVSWPEARADRVMLARAIFGRKAVESVDIAVEWADKHMNQTEKEPALRSWSALGKLREYFQRELADLTDTERTALHHLIRDVARMTLIGVMVAIDQPDYGEVRLELVGDQRRPELAESIRLAPDHSQYDLHDEVPDWLLSFSKYRDEFARLERANFGWVISAVEYYR